MLAQLRAAYEAAAQADERHSTRHTRARRWAAWDAYARALLGAS